MQTAFLIALFTIGACIGSFLCCQARRLHLQATHQKSLGRRSACLNCKYQLKWYDNLPIISWLALRGKCRHCHKKIGLAEIFSELGLAISFVLLGTTIDIATATSLDIATFIAALLLTCTLAFLAIYDGLYGELPTLCLIFAIFFAAIILILTEWSMLLARPFSPELIYQPLLSTLILGGIYLVLYLVSKGRWVGDGDWLLATSIAIALFNPWLALIALFLANLIACLIMYPIVKHKKHHKIHFGPFLVIAFIITYAFSNFFLSVL